MQYVWQATASSHTLPFLVDGQYVVPDHDSVFFAVFGPNVSILVVDTPVDHAGMTQVSVTISAVVNTPSAVTEPRWIVYRFTVGGLPYTAQVVYTVTPPILLTVSPDHVRAELGVSLAELPDNDLDLVAAVLDLTAGYPSATQTQLDKASVLSEALRVLPSCRNRAAQTVISGTEEFTRAKPEWDRLESDLRGRLFTLLDSMTTTPSVARTYLTISTPTDPVFGDGS